MPGFFVWYSPFFLGRGVQRTLRESGSTLFQLWVSDLLNSKLLLNISGPSYTLRSGSHFLIMNPPEPRLVCVWCPLVSRTGKNKYTFLVRHENPLVFLPRSGEKDTVQGVSDCGEFMPPKCARTIIT